MSAEELKNVVVDALDEVKGVDIRVLDVREKSSFADLMVIATGTSDRHVKALAGKVQEKCREAGERPIGVEGEREGQWVLIDLADVVVHVMTAQTRDFYNLEKLWGA
ncbi:ribosome silencing factor [Plasticicumulans sp.]|uniref:ribosome silencing factor n=1 Tax=Plasticicumulans sp. TaxID=2307179 RepID=UPI000FA5B570|nr:ribosome silencing factor [Plasticicumulans sp.]MBS0600139.1 ribosome silencing factor [Pseudomonadota bacterium]RTL00181.1 MAG: ribosome silencing factor [Xanthomonadales bacterium]HMW30892.1 ribosome silencing factor [Plasticicumulans sp.]HMW43349.1 ribosome silencing factor [Plasticicumulans sp.]HMZ11693.1 ribosome silencing factor [Plasticicumulans sp.]